MSVTAYTEPSYVRCNTTERVLVKTGLVYREVGLTQDAEALETVRAMGYQSAPAAFIEDDRWSGFRPDKIKVLTAAARESAVVTA